MIEFIAVIWSAPHDRRGETPRILKRLEVRSMTWRKAKIKIQRDLHKTMAKTSAEKSQTPTKLLRYHGIEVQVAEKRHTEPRPDCWTI